VVADDLPGQIAVRQLEGEGLDTCGIQTISTSSSEASTAQYVAFNDKKKDLVLAMADMRILEQDHRSENLINGLKQNPPEWFVVDGNWGSSTSVLSWFRQAKKAGVKTAFEPVSTAKATRLLAWKHRESSGAKPTSRSALPVFPNHLVDLVTPNALELAALHAHARKIGLFERNDWWRVIDALGIPSTGARTRFADLTSAELVDQGIPQQSVQLLPFMPCVLTKLGPRGVLMTMLVRKGDERLSSADSAPHILSRTRVDESDVGGVYMRLFQPDEVLNRNDVVSVNGVGDTFLGALMAAQVSTGKDIEHLVQFAQAAAVRTLKSREAVSPEVKSLRLHLDQLVKAR
jgi:pseudouridylate synthase / pseudouridine kinase